jgi:HlyD family secretion protein
VIIDASGLALERVQMETLRAAAVLRAREADEQAGVARERVRVQAAQRDVLVAQHAIAARAYDRTKRLFDQDAATAQQLDQTERDARVLSEQIDAQDRQIVVERRQVEAALARVRAVQGDIASAEARLAQIAERVADAEIRNPTAGTVLTTYAREGEFVQPGQRLYAIADLSQVEVRVYVTEPQLAGLRLGQTALVTVDAGNGRQTLEGSVIWIASEAEFTPTPIQTRDERAKLVYAVKIRVDNPHRLLKVGMPADVMFERTAAAS